jgi:SNF2 family DNA or RNA helicase
MSTAKLTAWLLALSGWQDQIEWHLKPGTMRFTVYHGSHRQKTTDLLGSFDVVLTTYETVRAEHLQFLGGGQSAFHTVSWHRIVLDEAHTIQNRSSKRFQAVHSLQAKHRWCLTGTPIQNRLEDLGSLVEFLRVDPFDTPGAFQRLFLDPISRQDNSGWERLRALIKCISLRRTKDALQQELALPPKHEIICNVLLDEEERRAYNLVKRRFALAIDSGGSKLGAFQLILRLRQICNHGIVLLPAELREWIEQASRFGPQVMAPLQADMSCMSCGRVLEEIMVGDVSTLRDLACGHEVCRICLPMGKSNCQDGVGESACCPVCRSEGRSGQPAGVDMPQSYRPSSKVRKLLQNLRHDRHQATMARIPMAKRLGPVLNSTPQKKLISTDHLLTPTLSVIFSTWTGMLDLIGTALTATRINFERIDGTKTHGQRYRALQTFRHDENCTVLLASMGSAATGWVSHLPVLHKLPWKGGRLRLGLP